MLSVTELKKGSIPERDGDKLYNTCCIFNNKGELIDKFRKIHLFDIDIPGKITFKESEVLTGGNKTGKIINYSTFII